ncbi:MAG: hypothetical protein MR633_04210 [Faecalibacterium prausnitzii]|nr:hypothetical protein [Faecalibacterium prausnitzii]
MRLNGGETINDKTITPDGVYYLDGTSDYTQGITIDTSKDVTINISSNVKYTGNSYLLDVKQAASLTINGQLTFEADCTVGGFLNVNNSIANASILLTNVVAQTYNNPAVQNQSGHVKIDGGSFVKRNTNRSPAIYNAHSAAYMEFLNSNVKSNYVAVSNDYGATLTINGGEYESPASQAVLNQENSTLIIYDGHCKNSASGRPSVYNFFTGTMKIYNGIFESEHSNVVKNCGDLEIFNGTFTSSAPMIMIATVENAVTKVHGGTYTAEGEDAVAFLCSKGTLKIDESEKPVTISLTKSSKYAIGNNGVLEINGGVISAPNGDAIMTLDSTGNTTISSGTIKNSKYGIEVRRGDPTVILENVTFENNENDIYLGDGQKITIKDTFTDTATVKCADAVPGRQITTNNTSGQEKLKLISNDVDTNGKTYRVAYDKSGSFRYLTPRAEDKYTVTAENATATATLDGTPLYSYDEIEAGESVTLTADAPEDGWVFASWQVTKGGLMLDDTTGTVTFQMPTSDVVVSAQYEYVGTPDAAAGNIQGALSAVVVGAAAGAIIYEAGTGIYRVINMPGIPMPSNRIELADLIWERAGKPEPQNTDLYDDIDEDDTDWQKAARWMVEQELMDDDIDEEKDTEKFHPYRMVTKLRVCLTWQKAKDKGLFDNTETKAE